MNPPGCSRTSSASASLPRAPMFSRVPLLDALDPESCYLSWELEIAGQIRAPSSATYSTGWTPPAKSSHLHRRGGTGGRRGRGAGRTGCSNVRTIRRGGACSRGGRPLPCTRRAVNRDRSALPRESRYIINLVGSFSSRNRCSAASPTASIRMTLNRLRQGLTQLAAIRASCRRA